MSSAEYRRPNIIELTPQRRAKLQEDLDAFLVEPGTQGQEKRVISQILPRVNPAENQMYVAPVGSGKTLALMPRVLLGTDDARPRRVILVEPTQQLCANAAETMGDLYGHDIVGHRFGGMSNDRKRNTEAPILAVTPGIFWNMIKRGEIGPKDHVEIDEVDKTFGFGVVEAAAAYLNDQYENRERDMGVGMATATFPTGTQSGNEFLEFANAELIETQEKTKWQRELLPTNAPNVVAAARNYLKDAANDGRNLLILVPTNRKVTEIASHLETWNADDAQQQDAQQKDPRPSENLRVVYFSKDQGAREFNEKIEAFLRDKMEALENDTPFHEKLVIVATYGSAASGVNYPVEDAIGDEHYIKATDEESGGTDLREVPVKGSVLAQAYGRIGRYTHGRFFLQGYDGRTSREEMLKPDPMPKPLLSKGNLQEVVFGFLEAGYDPRRIRKWYSGSDESVDEEIEKMYALLAAKGLLQEGKITELAKKITKNPLSDTNIDHALSVESSAPDVQAGLQEIYATAETASFRAILTRDIKEAEENKIPLSVTDLLIKKGLKKGLLEKRGDDLFMPDSDEPLPISDTAILLNIVRYLEGREDMCERGRLSIEKVNREYGFSYKAFERLVSSIYLNDRYNKENGRTKSKYYTKENWDTYLREVILDNGCKTLQAAPDRNRSNSNIISSGIFVDDHVKKYGREKTQLVATLHITNTKGAEARTTTTFTGSVLGAVPEDLIPWLPENLLGRVQSLSQYYSRYDRMEATEKGQFTTDHPHIVRFIQQCQNVEKALAEIKSRTEKDGIYKIPSFEYNTWFKQMVIPHLMVQRVDSVEGFEKMLSTLEQKGIGVAPDINNFVSARLRSEIDSAYPRVIKAGNAPLSIEYSYYGPTIKEFNVAAPLKDNQFDVESHPLLQTDLQTVTRELAKTKVGDKVKIELFGKKYLPQELVQMAPEDLKEIIKAGCKIASIADEDNRTREEARALGIKKSTITKEQCHTLFSQVEARAFAVVDGKYATVQKRVSVAGIEDVSLYAEEGVPSRPNYMQTSERSSIQTTTQLTKIAYNAELEQINIRFRSALNAASPKISDMIFGYSIYDKCVPERLFSSALEVNLWAQSEKMGSLCSQEAKLGEPLPTVQFDTDQYFHAADAFLQEYNHRLGMLESLQADFDSIRTILSQGELPSTFVHNFTELIKSFSQSSLDLPQKLQEFKSYCAFLGRRLKDYTELGIQEDFNLWLSRKEQNFANIDSIRNAIPVFTEYTPEPVMYVIYEKGEWVQCVKSEEGKLQTRKGYKSTYKGTSARDVATEIYDKPTLGKKGEALLWFGIDERDQEELRNHGVSLPNLSDIQRTVIEAPVLEEYVAPTYVNVEPTRSVVASFEDYFEMEEPVERPVIERASKHTENINGWKKVAELISNSEELVKLARTERINNNQREVELAIILAHTTLSWEAIAKIPNFKQAFKYYDGAVKRAEAMMKDLMRQQAKEEELDEELKIILDELQIFQVCDAAIAISRRMMDEWIGTDIEVQNNQYAKFLEELSIRNQFDPTITQALEEYTKSKKYDDIPPALSGLFLEVA